MNAPAIMFTWTDDGTMLPHPRYRRQCDREFVVGENYPFAIAEERSAATHRHYFACVREAWINLPEDMQERFPTEDHLRKYALVKAGYCDERSIVAASNAEAQRFAAFVKPMDDFAIVTVALRVVTVRTAKSQSARAMGKQVFQESKQRVLEVLADLLNVSADDLARTARSAA
jgi:hypothetical protein